MSQHIANAYMSMMVNPLAQDVVENFLEPPPNMESTALNYNDTRRSSLGRHSFRPSVLPSLTTNNST